MDILAHGLWTAVAAKATNNKLAKKSSEKKLNLWQATFWGVFPDLFAFAIPFFWIVWNLSLGNIHSSDLPRPSDVEPGMRTAIPVFILANKLYNISHSAIVFLFTFLLTWLVLKKPVWELGGWLFHILIDIPTHSYRFYPTPFLWPISGWKFIHGFSWSVPWFMILNYSALVVVYFLLWRKKKKSANTILS